MWYVEHVNPPADMNGGDGALDEEPALPSNLMPDPLKGTKLGSIDSGSDVLSAHTHMISCTADTTSFGCTEAPRICWLFLY